MHAFAAFAVRRGVHIHRQAMREARAAKVVDAELMDILCRRHPRRCRGSLLDDAAAAERDCQIINLRDQK